MSVLQSSTIDLLHKSFAPSPGHEWQGYYEQKSQIKQVYGI
jgi:hypothetical protein